MSASNKPLLSIIIPVYNVERYLDDCICSVLKQDIYDIEVILVDDGSKDGSGEICDRYASKDPRVKVIHKENEGLLKARISGFKLAKSDYIGFVDSDDYVASSYFREMYEKAYKFKSDMVCSSFTYFNDLNFDGSKTKICKVGFSGYFDKSRLVSEFYPNFISKYLPNSSEKYFGYTWEKIYKKELLDKAFNSVPLDVHIYEDISVSFYCALHSQKIYFNDENTGYYYRQRKDSMLHSFRSDYNKDVKKLLKYMKGEAKHTSKKLRIDSFLDYYCVGRMLIVFSSMPYTDISWKELKNAIQDLFTDPIWMKESILKEQFSYKQDFIRKIELYAFIKKNRLLALLLTRLRFIYSKIRTKR